MILKSQVTPAAARPGRAARRGAAGTLRFSQVKPVEDGPEGLIAALAVCFRPGGHAGDAQHDRRR